MESLPAVYVETGEGSYRGIPCHPKCALAPAAPSERADESKDAPLAAGVEGDELVIRVGVGTLAYCFETGEENQPFDEKANDFRRSYKVTDLHKFAKGVGIRLQDEEEDGSTPLTKIFDEAFIRAVEDAMGVDEDGRIVTKQMLQYGAGLSSQEGVK